MQLKKLKKTLRIQDSPKNSTINKISYIAIILSSLGIADTIYLTISHYAKLVLACPETAFINCVKVTTSSYSEIFGIPVALFGLLFFTTMFFVQLPIFWKSTANWVRYIRLGFAATGMISVFWFVYVELHLLHSICLYCTAVHVLTFSLFVTTVIGTSLITPASLSSEQRTQD